jgi:hypothetical protein
MSRMKPRRPTLQDTMEANAKALRGLMALSGKPMPAELEAPVREAKKVRAAIVTKDSDNSEASVMTDIAEVYKTHPNILFAVRQNSGAAKIGDTPIWFWKWLRRNGVEMTLTDTWGLLRDGRMFAIEAKKRDWKCAGSGDSAKAVRELRQLAFINVVKSGGGVGGFVTSAEQVMEILK